MVQERGRVPQSRPGHRSRHLTIEDRPGIYAALRVAELWRYDGVVKRMIIERLGEDGSYQAVAESQFLPVRSDEVSRWVLEEDRRAGSSWARRLRAWARDEIAARLPR